MAQSRRSARESLSLVVTETPHTTQHLADFTPSPRASPRAAAHISILRETESIIIISYSQFQVQDCDLKISCDRMVFSVLAKDSIQG